MRKFVKIAACAAMAAVIAAAPVYADEVKSVPAKKMTVSVAHKGELCGKREHCGWEKTDEKTAVKMKKVERVQLTQEQKTELAEKAEEFMKARKAEWTEKGAKRACEAKHEHCKNLEGLAKRAEKPWRVELTEEQKAAFEKMRELGQKLKAAQTDEEKEAVKAEIKALMEQCGQGRAWKKAEGAADTSVALSEVKVSAPMVEMELEFVPVPDEN